MKHALVFVALVAGCGSRPALDYGRALFDDASVSSAASNPFKCATCHETTPTAMKSLPGYSMHDSATRDAWWGGTVTTLLDATNQCVNQFMRGKPLAADDEKGRAIFVYLSSLSPDPSAPTLPLTVVQNIVDVPSGDATRGKMWWDQGCGNCHGAPHSGDGRISDVASVVPDDSLAAHGTDPKTGARPVVIEKVRHGKFFNVGGNMPLFSVEALSDGQLGDILAYLEGFGLPPSQ
ncbi:MAG: putative lipoprotein [bacterium]|nr:putative lipoprotein [bacterium]